MIEEQIGLLRSLMDREVALLRELLSSLKQEQRALLACESQMLKEILTSREPLMDALAQAREARNVALTERAKKQMPQLKNLADLDTEGWQFLLEGLPEEEAIGVSTLKDQVLALLEQMNQLSQKNNALIRSKIRTTQQLVQRLDPEGEHRRYNEAGQYLPPRKRTTVAVINREV